MPKWIHEREQHIKRENPSMPESEAWGIATEQAYATGKAPKNGFGTASSKREAHNKYDSPKSEYKQTADPAHKSKTSSLHLWAAFSDELQKIAAAATVATVTKPVRAAKASLPKLVSKPVVKEPEPPSSTLDVLRSSQTIPPPPVTSG